MTVKVDDIVSKVHILLDEIAEDDAELIQAQDNAEMDTIIKDRLTESVDYVHLYCDKELLAQDEVELLTGATGSTICTMSVPDDYLRFMRVSCTSWPYNVTGLTPEEKYGVLADEYCGANYERPAVCRVGNLLYMFTKKSSSDTFQLSYIKKSSVDTSDDADTIDIDSNMTDAVIYRLAGIVLMIYNEAKAQNMIAQSMALMGVQMTMNNK